MIRDLGRDQFVQILREYLSPTAPIQSEEHLFGRSKQLQLIEQALASPGRSIFIYGDRGVGKTSLAQTVAHAQQSAAHEPILLACTPQTEFVRLMTTVLAQLQPKSNTSTISHGAKLGYQGVGVEYNHTHKPESAEQADLDLNDAVTRLIEAAAKRNNESTVVVIDEFDRITSDQERTQFADFIKQLGDRRVPVHFVFCGVSESLEKLLGAHASCYRYLEGIELKTLSWEARFEIIDAAAKALHVTIEERPRYRIAAISDGFPHYIHRMCEKLFWQMFDDPVYCAAPTIDHYREAVIQSVLGIEQHLKHTYDAAVMKDAAGYEQVLWAIADHADLIRSTERIYESYSHLFGETGDQAEAVLDRSTVVSRLNSLKGASCGHIVVSPKKGWYQFRENIIRGYVRLRAEEQGCELALDYSAASSSDSSLKWRQRVAPRSRAATRRPDRHEPYI